MPKNINKTDILNLVTRFIREEQINQPIKQAWLFGSWAYGNPDENSDIDVGIVLPAPVDIETELVIARDAGRFDLRIESHTFEEDYFNNARHSLIYDIKQKGIQIL